MSNLKKNLSELLSRQSMSVSELERRAGTKPYAIRNILHGKSIKPSADMVLAIAKELGCSVEDLLGGGFIVPPTAQNSSSHAELVKEANIKVFKQFKFNEELFYAVAQEISQYYKDNNIEISFWEYLTGVSEIYQYSFENNAANIDQRYAAWWLKRNLTAN